MLLIKMKQPGYFFNGTEEVVQIFLLPYSLEERYLSLHSQLKSQALKLFINFKRRYIQLKFYLEQINCPFFFLFLLDLIDPVALETPLPKNLVAQISALALQLDSEDLHNYSGSQLFEMHEKLCSMANSIIKNLQSRWRSPTHENSVQSFKRKLKVFFFFFIQYHWIC